MWRATCPTPKPDAGPGTDPAAGAAAEAAARIGGVRQLPFPVDVKYARSVNENYQELRRLRISSILVALLWIAGGVAAAIFGSGGWYILAAALVVMGVGSIVMAYLLPRKVGSIKQQYERSQLVGAVLAEKRRHGVTLLGLVNVSRTGDVDPVYALVTRTATAVTGHPMVVGAKIPCVAVLQDRSSRYRGASWQTASLMPLSWGTKDKSVIGQGQSLIAGYEWDLLQRSIARAAEVDKSPNQMILLSNRDLPDALRD